jgi:hypothetical protein
MHFMKQILCLNFTLHAVQLVGDIRKGEERRTWMKMLVSSFELQQGNYLEIPEERNRVLIELIIFRESNWIRLEQSLGKPCCYAATSTFSTGESEFGLITQSQSDKIGTAQVCRKLLKCR